MVDLHSHTDASDGSDAPLELIDNALRAGVGSLSITDHDTFAGYFAARTYAASQGLDLLCGIELSTKYEGKTVHLLGYFPGSEPSEEFSGWLVGLQDKRRDRNRRLVGNLQQLGVEITLEEVEAIGKSQAGRPHFASILLRKKYVKTMQEAFDKYLDEAAPGYVQRKEVPVNEAIARVKAAGGITSLAHPIRVAKNDWDTLALWTEKMASAGMGAIEVFHSDHTIENVGFYGQLAERFGLLVTGGSDFHGANKPNISLGTGHRGNLAVPYSLLENLRNARR